MKNSVMVIVAHPDDETISMGGTIRKHISNGDEVNIISMTDGVSSRNSSNAADVDKRNHSAELASKILGFNWATRFNFKDNQMDSYPLIEVIRCIEKAKEKYQPNIIYTHSGADLNIDHRIVAKAVLTSFRPQPGELCKEIRLFEVASATDYSSPSLFSNFVPNLYISIDKTWEFKLKALNSYNSEMKDFPHSRSIEAINNLAKLRGSQVGYSLAEAFEVIRKLED